MVAAVAGAALAAAPGAHARDAVVTSFDETPIVAHFFPADRISDGGRAPTIMVGHGWGGTGESDPDEGLVETYTGRGYNVLTWDARGFGGSGGTVMIDHPKFEARDAQALIDFIAAQPEARLDAPGDPRVGMDGPSYGGAIQFITAARDDRVDAITPTIAWNSQNRSLYRSRVVKAGWDLALVGIGIPTSAALGVFSPAGIQTGHQHELFYEAVVDGASTGALSQEVRDWFDEHGPDHLLRRIEAPTMIAQGTVDTLFTLDEAHHNYRGLARGDVPLRMMWFCGGHGLCRTGTDASGEAGLTGSGGLVQRRKQRWFARHLKGRSGVVTGPRFEWIDEEGTWHRSNRYPLGRESRVRGNGAGTIPLTPGTVPGSGFLIFATPSPAGMSVPIETPPPGSTVLGKPNLHLRYTATGASTGADPGRTAIYAQLVDRQRDVVVNNLATPVPIRLDGEPHRLSIPMERIASLSTEAGYELQFVPATSVYDFQRAAGAVEVERAAVSLPVARSG